MGRSGNEEKRKKKDRGDADGDRERGRDRSKSKKPRKKEQQGSWFWRILTAPCKCSQVSVCTSADKLDARARHRRRDKERSKDRRRRKGEEEDAIRPEDGAAARAKGGSAMASTAEGDVVDDQSEQLSDGSYTSYATESEYSRTETARSSRSVPRSERQLSKSVAKEAPDTAGRRSVKTNAATSVATLADSRGTELLASLSAPAASQSKGSKGGRGGDEDDPPLSARSGRSEGARSARSVRSEGGHSEGGMSVKSTASVSIRQYMGYLSDRKSPAEVKKMVKDFVRQMVKGREMGVLCADGTLKPVTCGLTRPLDTFKIKLGDNTRKVKLSEVDRIVFGNPEDLNDLETPLDETCSTLELESSECISFKFAERQAAELFTLCLQLFVDGQRAK